MTALPMALRERFQSLIEESNCARAAARRLKVSAATGVRWAQKIKQTGSIDIQRMGRPKGTGKLAPYDGLLVAWLAQDADMTLTQLKAALFEATGVSASLDARSKALKRLGYRHKKSRWWPPSAAA